MLMTFVLTIILLLCNIDVHAATGRVFYDGFESGSYATGWESGFADGDGTIPAADNQGHDGLHPPVAGSRMMECRYGNASTDTWFCRYIDIDAMYTNEIFIRLWMRLDTDVQANQGSMAHLLRFYSGGSHDILTSMIGDGSGNEANTQMITDALWSLTRPDGSPTYYDFASPGVGDREWHKYELYLNNSTNTYKIWEDDVLLMSLSDAVINVHFANFLPLHNWGTPKPTDNNTHFYFDEVEVYSDLGSGTVTGTMAGGDIALDGGGGGGASTPGSMDVKLNHMKDVKPTRVRMVGP